MAAVSSYSFPASAILFIDADKDGNTHTTMAEFRAFADALYQAADTDQNGSIRHFEMNELSATRFGAVDAGLSFRRVDENQDGIITGAEFLRTLLSMFEAVDANHDQVVTRAELLRTPAIGTGRSGAGKASRGGSSSGRGGGRGGNSQGGSGGAW